uniref:Uncharacterized protein n=1 Tax=Nelumbo nucifera TaxID=4432 RepID=A0A822Z7H2_NELNU|nr:TPA_asm: hypothetical protein HUJ06_013228 [Nelumbo nucifera]
MELLLLGNLNKKGPPLGVPNCHLRFALPAYDNPGGLLASSIL